MSEDKRVMKTDLLIIGGGPAGLAAAISAKKAGASDLCILERDSSLGGILNQCIHNGFGLCIFQEELTGPEYAQRYIDQIEELKIPYKLDSMVVNIAEKDGTEEKIVSVMNRKDGLYTIEAKAVILAMGCRERPRGALNIPGYRPAGIYSAGAAQKYVNIEGRMPGREVVILGSGDIGLIMARRLTMEGAKVKMVLEIMPHSGGLRRNIVQCLEDFDIPLKLCHTVVDVKGKQRVEAVVIAQVDDNGKPIADTEEEVICDTLLLSCGLIPENELSEKLGVTMDLSTNGPIVDESLQTSKKGVFACGNVLHVHDLVDHVSEEAADAGVKAAAYLQGILPETGEKYIPKRSVTKSKKIQLAYDGAQNKITTIDCIGCPKGCCITVEMQGDDIKNITGNSCPKGADYAVKELTDPHRIVTSLVKVSANVKQNFTS